MKATQQKLWILNGMRSVHAYYSKRIALSNCIQFCIDDRPKIPKDEEIKVNEIRKFRMNREKDKMQRFMRVWNLCFSNNKG